MTYALNYAIKNVHKEQTIDLQLSEAARHVMTQLGEAAASAAA